MADFSIRSTEIGGPALAGSQPVAPVQRNPTGPVVPVDLFKGVVGAATSYANEKALASKNQVFTSYQKELSAIAQATDSGSISHREAAARHRSLTNRYLAENPAAGGEFSKTLIQIQKDVLTGTSLGLAEETREDTRALQQQVKVDAVKKGLLDPFGEVSPQTERAAIYLAQSLNRADDEFERIQRASQEYRANNADVRAEQSAEREAFDHTNKQAARNALGGVRNSASEYLVAAITESRGQIQNGKPFEEVQGALSRQIANLKAQGSQSLIDDPDSRKLFETQMDELSKAALEDMNPITRSAQTAAIYQDRLKRTQLMMMDADPELLRVASISQIVPNVPLAQFQNNRAITRALTASSEGRYSGAILSRDTDTQRTLFQASRETVNQALSGRGAAPADQALRDVATLTNSMTAEASKVSPGDPTSLRTYTQYLATPEVAQLVDRAMLDRQTNAITKQVWQEVYQRDVLTNVTPKLNSPLGAAVTTDGQSVQPNLGNVIDFEMRGGQLVVVDKVPQGVYASPQLIRQRAQDLRNTMNEINTLIRAGAHLEGTTDYTKFWEANKHNLLPDFYPSPEREAEAKSNGYLGGNRRNPANWSKPDGNRNEE